MKIFVDICLNTDGDFSLDHEKIKKKFPELAVLKSGYIQDYMIFGKLPMDNYCNRARDLLKTVLCSIRFGTRHYYLMRDVYHIFDSAITALSTPDYFYESIGGNYHGTHIELKVIKDEEDEENTDVEFTTAQLERIDEVYGAVEDMCYALITPPQYLNHETHEVKRSDVMEFADTIAEMLTKSGYTVYFPTRTTDGDLECITDIY